ncbi:hypothetical protein AN219_22730 [Streptomyces nanshensis]|nr:hypothetical protein AN219_22730 [Streptomyces nanshensis]
MTTNPPSLHQLRLHQLAVYLREAEEILADWDLYSDLHSNDEGWPLDDVAYGLRQRQRDAATWRAFRPLLYSGHHLLDSAAAQLATTPSDEQTKRWAHSLTTLSSSLGKLRALQTEWSEIREALPENARPGTEEFDEPLADRNADGWHYLDTWALHGQTLIAIDTATRHKDPPAPRPVPARSPEPPATRHRPPRPR